MKTIASALTAGILLASTLASLGQPTITSLRLSGQAATVDDTSHLYLSNSVSLGANLIFKVTAGGAPPFHYQWQFNSSDLPDQTNVTLILTNVQPTNAGDYTVIVTNAAGATNRVATMAVDPTFTKIVTGPIVTDVGFSAGGTWGDYNGDGFLDLFVFNADLNSGDTYAPFLYRNNGDGTFTKITSGPPVNVTVDSFSACWGDYNNDGNLDLYVATQAANLLFHSNGNGSFTRLWSASSGLRALCKH